MRYANFCGRETSVIALGTMDFGGKIGEGQAREFMDAYVEIGGNFIDTARIYGDFAREIQGGSEQVIGRWLEDRRCREKIVLGTKGGHPDVHSMHTGRLSRSEILDDMRRSLDNLRTDCVDIYWLHRDDVSRPVGEILETLNGFLQAGYTRFIGVSNWTAVRIREANAYAAAHGMTGFCANQPQFSLARQEVMTDPTLYQMDREMYEFHVETGMPCVPFSSQAKGFFIKLHDGAEISDGAKRRFDSPGNRAIYARLLALSEETGYSVGALSLAYLTCNRFDIFPIVGVSRLSQVESLREAGDARISLEQAVSLREV